MGVNGINSIFGSNQQYMGMVDRKELEAAKKLAGAGFVSSVQDFLKLSTAQKVEKVEEYNKVHPNNPIEYRGAKGDIQPPQVNGVQEVQYPQGSEMDEFQKYLKGRKIKLQ